LAFKTYFQNATPAAPEILERNCLGSVQNRTHFQNQPALARRTGDVINFVEVNLRDSIREFHVDAFQECLRGMIIVCGPSMMFVAWMLWRSSGAGRANSSDDSFAVD
jgi:hypothetical protein